MRYLKSFNESNDNGVVSDIFNIVVDDDKLGVDINIVDDYLMTPGKPSFKYDFKAHYEVYTLNHNPLIHKNSREVIDHLTNVCVNIFNRLTNDDIDFYNTATLTHNGRWDCQDFKTYLEGDREKTLEYVEFFIK